MNQGAERSNGRALWTGIRVLYGWNHTSIQSFRVFW